MDTTEYNRRYYIAHKEKLQAVKYHRYHNDSQYREAVCQRVAFYNRLKSLINTKLPIASLTVEEHGFTLSQAAKAIGVSSNRLKAIQDKLPPVAWYKGGQPLYTTSQVRWLYEVIIAKIDKSQIQRILEAIWHIPWNIPLARKVREEIKNVKTKNG
ncbi:MAG: hypothetical protein ACUVUQ_07505 [Thermodesulfovibrionales bacterium]